MPRHVKIVRTALSVSLRSQDPPIASFASLGLLHRQMVRKNVTRVILVVTPTCMVAKAAICAIQVPLRASHRPHPVMIATQDHTALIMGNRRAPIVLQAPILLHPTPLPILARLKYLFIYTVCMCFDKNIS